MYVKVQISKPSLKTLDTSLLTPLLLSFRTLEKLWIPFFHYICCIRSVLPRQLTRYPSILTAEAFDYIMLEWLFFFYQNLQMSFSVLTKTVSFFITFPLIRSLKTTFFLITSSIQKVYQNSLHASTFFKRLKYLKSLFKRPLTIQ